LELSFKKTKILYIMAKFSFYKNLMIGISIFEFHLKDINNLVFLSISNLLWLNNFLKNKNQRKRNVLFSPNSQLNSSILKEIHNLKYTNFKLIEFKPLDVFLEA